MKTMRSGWWVLFAAIGPMWACGSEGGHHGSTAGTVASESASLTAYCSKSCEKMADCSAANDKADATKNCEAKCAKGTEGLEGKLTESFVEDISACAGSECSMSLFTCARNDMKKSEVREQVKVACAALDKGYDGCNDDFDRGQCEELASALSDDVLQTAMDSCANVDCKQLQKCVEASIATADYTSLDDVTAVSMVQREINHEKSTRPTPTLPSDNACVDAVIASGAYDFAYECE